MDIRLEASSMASWQHLIKDALHNIHATSNSNIFTLTDDLESYLIFLLERFTTNTNFVNTVLAIEYLESQKLTGQNKSERLRDLGDSCLLFAGFYPEQAHRRLVTLPYFVSIGREAYDQISQDNINYSHYKGLAALFSNLALNFVNLINLLHEIKLLDKTNSWQLDEFTKFEKKILELKQNNNTNTKIIINNLH